MNVKLELYSDRFLKRVNAKKRRVLFKLGGYLRTTMQRSMRYSTKPSRSGKPPHAHRKTGAHLRKGIRFNVDLEAESVVCGPDLKPDSKVLSLKPLPQILNEGGEVSVRNSSETVRIAPRPFTQPVFSSGGDRLRQLIEQEAL